MLLLIYLKDYNDVHWIDNTIYDFVILSIQNDYRFLEIILKSSFINDIIG